MSVATAPDRNSFVEAGGIEAIPLSRRHGSPWQLLATWTAPNLEFATVYVGVIADNFVQLFERYATIVLGVVFLLATVFALASGALGGGAHGGPGGFGAGFGGFVVAASAAFGYAAGWNPYAADYTRYLAPT